MNKNSSIIEIIIKYWKWTIPYFIMIIILILIPSILFFNGKNITVPLSIATSSILAITTLLIQLISLSENKENLETTFNTTKNHLFFQIKYSRMYDTIYKFKLFTSHVIPIYRCLEDNVRYLDDEENCFLKPKAYLVLLFVLIEMDKDITPNLPKSIIQKIEEKYDFFLLNDEYDPYLNDGLEMSEAINIQNMIQNTTFTKLLKCPFFDPPDGGTQLIKDYYNDILKIKESIPDHMNKFMNLYKHVLHESDLIDFFHDLRDYFDENTIEEIIFEDID